MTARLSPGRGVLTLGRVLLLSQLREQPGRLAVTVLSIALGVALGAAVYLVNAAALNEFGLATKRLVGDADVVIRGPRDGFAESLYTQLARDPAVRAASPVLELEAALPADRDTLKILGLDPFAAAALQPALIGDVERRALDLFAPDAIVLSNRAAAELNLRAGDRLRVIVGDGARDLRVIDVLPEGTYSQALGIMDIASAQWLFGKIGRLNRIDLSLRPGVDAEAYRRALNHHLPAGTLAIAPQTERERAATVTRAYRVNLNMLALVALWTGAFLVFSTQSLSALRRRRSFGLLRALGVTRRELELALLAEGALLGLAGSAAGIVLALACAAGLLRLLNGDLGNAQLHVAGAALGAAPLSLLVFTAIGTTIAAAGAWFPARVAARQAPALALKGGDQAPAAPGFSAAQVAVDPLTAPPQLNPHMGMLDPSGIGALAGAAVRLTCCWATAPPASRSAETASPDLIRADLKILDRMGLLLVLFRFVDHEFARIDEHHHEHPARKYVVGGDLALIVRVPHVGPAALVGGVRLYVRRLQVGAIRRRAIAAGCTDDSGHATGSSRVQRGGTGGTDRLAER